MSLTKMQTSDLPAILISMISDVFGTIGSPGDNGKAKQLMREGVAGIIQIPDLRTLISLSFSETVICPDGRAMHVAAALGKPIVALFGDSPVDRWRPWGVEQRVLLPETRHVQNLTAQQALAAYRQLG